MKIERDNSRYEVTVDSIPYGHVFEYENTLYMVVVKTSCDCDPNEVNIIDLKWGTERTIDSSTRVTKVDATLHIN